MREGGRGFFSGLTCGGSEDAEAPLEPPPPDEEDAAAAASAVERASWKADGFLAGSWGLPKGKREIAPGGRSGMV